MKPKLKVYQQFAETILPHEARYLESLANFQDDEKKLIFSTTIHNALQPEEQISFDDEIDKRKYHHVKNWMQKKLDERDVDKIGAWILEFNKKLSLDIISVSEEKEMLFYIKNYKNIGFNFQILYEMAREYRSYLMIRLRYEDHSIVSGFLLNFENAYLKAKEIQEKLYVATKEITEEYTSKTADKNNWEKWLLKVFENQHINGNNRYKAFILVAFHYTSTKQSGKLQKIFDKIDDFFSRDSCIAEDFCTIITEVEFCFIPKKMILRKQFISENFRFDKKTPIL